MNSDQLTVEGALQALHTRHSMGLAQSSLSKGRPRAGPQDRRPRRNPANQQSEKDSCYLIYNIIYKRGGVALGRAAPGPPDPGRASRTACLTG